MIDVQKTDRWVYRPLTRTRKDDGSLYHRERHAEEEIHRLCGLGQRTRKEVLLARHQAGAPDRLREETLVYALRECTTRGDDETAWQLAELLTERVSGHIARQLAKWRLPEADADDVTRDLFALLFDALFSREPSGEFWEVRFWVCLDRRLWNLVEKRQASLDVQLSESTESETLEGGESSLMRLAERHPGPEALAEYGEALTVLAEHERLAVYLKYIEGLPEESDDPERQSVAKILGVTGRTVRNYLRRAEQKLREWNEK
ncbi:sigma-70 family RNA polymerase sigma factor [Armatimonas sp.]|uniref:sigma-70 family RNA polymerase sigma factor n=1 Tax=Armatimonas sp. TaxID=1872638 RepID=UPI00286C81A8|nr:sigma-70 family RNA polymerase sigma factor [Armatimonas sp.]